MELYTVLLWATLGSVISLSGAFLLVKSRRLREKASLYVVPFGAGALLAVAFLSLLPEAVESGDIHDVATATLIGFIIFFLIERLTSGWFHQHHGHQHVPVGATRNGLVIIGDILHNAIDGAAIGAAFLVSPAAGIATSIAVAAHEVPQEIGDMGILLSNGMRPKRALLINLLSATVTIVVAAAIFLFGSENLAVVPLLLSLAAGFFIYIAASDIIPDIHEKPHKEANTQTIMLLLGVLTLVAITMLLPHAH